MPRRRMGRLGARMAAADHDDVKMFHVKHSYFPMQKLAKISSSRCFDIHPADQRIERPNRAAQFFGRQLCPVRSAQYLMPRRFHSADRAQHGNAVALSRDRRRASWPRASSTAVIRAIRSANSRPGLPGHPQPLPRRKVRLAVDDKIVGLGRQRRAAACRRRSRKTRRSACARSVDARARRRWLRPRRRCRAGRPYPAP